MRKCIVLLLTLSLLIPLPVFAADQADLMQKIDALSKELDRLKQQMQDMQKKDQVQEQRISTVEQKGESAPSRSAFQIGGDYRFRMDYLKGTTHDAFVSNGAGGAVASPATTYKNSSLFTNRFGLNLKADATEDITVKARLLMYKVWGMESANTVTGANGFFADKMSIFDANIGHVPEDNTLRVDYAYATWTDIAGKPIWFSIGRRPSTGGVPSNLRQNTEKSGTAGVPAFLVDWAFDGGTIGVAPDIDALPGAFAKLCFGKGFDSGFSGNNNGLKDVWMIGLNVVPYDTDKLHLEFQWNRAFDIFAQPESLNQTMNPGAGLFPNTNLGNVDQFGGLAMTKFANAGPGDLNLFLAGAASMTHPNNNAFANTYGLLWDTASGRKSNTGYLVYLGGRYDIKSTGTKLGLEYNHGSKNWLSFAPASDDMWTTKVGTRGSVYEAYLIQELNKKPIAKRGKAFFRVGYQHYQFDYTGSQNWLGAPVKISDMTTAPTAAPQFFPVIKNANDVYLTFDVLF